MSKAGKNTEKYHKKWYKLDLSANVYPTLQRKDFSSVFRLSVTLTEPVDPVLLEQAFHLTIPRFPTFASAIRAGLFWRYLEPNPLAAAAGSGRHQQSVHAHALQEQQPVSHPAVLF